MSDILNIQATLCKALTEKINSLSYFFKNINITGLISIVSAGALKTLTIFRVFFYNATCLGDLNGYQQIVEILDQEMPLAK